MTNIFKMSDFFFKYKGSTNFVLEDISLEIGSGEILLVVGASGSGKSTLCYALSGIIPWVIDGEMAGDLEFNGKSLWNMTLSELSSQISIVLQNPDEQLVSFSVPAET